MKQIQKHFRVFYNDHVVLSRSEQNRLTEIYNINLERLKSGLNEYNEEHSTKYRVVDHVVQGSKAMNTIIKCEENSYDIDVAIIFDKNNMPQGCIATKRVVVDALERKCGRLKKAPEMKTNCVRVDYQKGYHIDFAVYGRSGEGEYEYYHCGSDWTLRDPRAINRWFKEQNDASYGYLREFVRLLKMFCRSRSYWVMPGGLILSVLVAEALKSIGEERLRTIDKDEVFFYILEEIDFRLAVSKDIFNPTASYQNLVNNDATKNKVKSLRNRLSEHLEALRATYSGQPNYDDARDSWASFFNHSYWLDIPKGHEESSYPFTPHEAVHEEDYIENILPVVTAGSAKVKVDCWVNAEKSKTKLSLRNQNEKGNKLDKDMELEFFISGININEPYDVYWKVKNYGYEAEKENCLRGEIITNRGNVMKEHTKYAGTHYVECYIIKNGICVASDKIFVPIN